jgi:hypothetical protein
MAGQPATQLSFRQVEAYTSLTTQVFRKPFEDALIAFIVICQVAISLVVNELFVEFLQILYPQVKNVLPKAAKTIRQWIIDAFKVRKIKLKAELAKSNSMVHFSFDLWTSPNHMALLGIVAHYIDQFGQNQTVSSSGILLLKFFFLY